MSCRQLHNTMDLSTSIAYTSSVASLAALAVVAKRLWFSPLQGVPGSPWARVTFWYKIYWDLIQDAAMVQELERLHKKHGSVVRISPNEIHFNDPKAYNAIYISSLPKEPKFYAGFGEDDSSFGSPDVAFAKKRKDVIAPLFSRRAILILENTVQSKVDKLIERLSAWDKSKHVDVTSALHSTTLDVISDYCFGESFDALDTRDFDAPILRALQSALPIFWLGVYFPKVKTIIESLPTSIANYIAPDAAGFAALAGQLFSQINRLLDDPDSLQSAEHETVYHHLLTINHAKGHNAIPTKKSLFEEAIALTVAGSDTVGAAVSLGTFYVLHNPDIKERLVKELIEAWPEKDTPFAYSSLEQLPYLTAVIKESLRVSHGVVTPAPRVVPQPTQIGSMLVPAGTIVSMGASFMHFNEDVFPEPRRFLPERWLDGKAKELDPYLVAFSKGPRSCLGVNLAYCELYLLFGNIFRKLEMEIYDTTEANFQTYMACFMPVFPKHFKALVSAREAQGTLVLEIQSATNYTPYISAHWTIST